MKPSVAGARVMDYKSVYYPESRFGGFTDVDSTLLFYARVHSLIDPSSVVLDVGCGRGVYGKDPVPFTRQLRVLKGKCRRVIGIDLDPRGSQNPFVDEFRLIEGPRWPVGGECIDLCLCDFVLEHVEDPDFFFSECERVIKRGGYLCIRTPNVLGYVALLSRLVPSGWHGRVLARALTKGFREKGDVFPGLYRCNTTARLRHMLDKHGFDHCVYGHQPEPAYLSFSGLLYPLGVIHQRFSPNFLKVQIFGFARKRRR